MHTSVLQEDVGVGASVRWELKIEANLDGRKRKGQM